MSMGERVRILRKKNGLSQAQLGAKIGAEANTVSRWEKDKIEASHSYVVKLANALNTTTDYLLGRTEDMSVSVIANDTDTSISHMNKGMLVYTFSNGERLELPPTQESYAFLREMQATSKANAIAQPV